MMEPIVTVPADAWNVVYVPKHPYQKLYDEKERAVQAAVALENAQAEAVDILTNHDPSCPGEAIQRALAVLDPGA